MIIRARGVARDYFALLSRDSRDTVGNIPLAM